MSDKEKWDKFILCLSTKDEELLNKLNKYNDLRLGARDFVLYLKVSKDFFISFYKFILFFGNKHLFKRKEYESIKNHKHLEGVEVPKKLKDVLKKERFKNLMEMNRKIGTNNRFRDKESSSVYNFDIEPLKKDNKKEKENG